MNYLTALADFSRIYCDADHQPPCVTSATRNNLAVYRNNVVENRVAALAESHPIVRSLVGEDFFAALARLYVDQHASGSANLHEDGTDLAGFLAVFPHVQDVPYLPDVVRLDLALHRAHYAPDCVGLTIQSLVDLAPEAMAEAVFKFHPACALVQSPDWPIGAILDFHHGGATPDMSAGAQSVWVWRDHWEIIDQAESICLACWLDGNRIEDGLQAATQCNAAFNPSGLLQRMFARGLVMAIKLGDKA